MHFPVGHSHEWVFTGWMDLREGVKIIKLSSILLINSGYKYEIYFTWTKKLVSYYKSTSAFKKYIYF